MTYGVNKPSQAEGERDEDTRQRRVRPAADEEVTIDRPSQAEGDRETIEEDLRGHS